MEVFVTIRHCERREAISGFIPDWLASSKTPRNDVVVIRMSIASISKYRGLSIVAVE
jgi:hypothetical protein